MKRRHLNKSTSKKVFRKSTGIHSLNKARPQNFRGGIRL